MKWLWSKTSKKKLNIEFCEKNLDRFLTEQDFPLYESFLKESHITYKEYDCQSHCKTCKKQAYAIVNGDLITASSSKELLEQLKEEQ